MDIDRPDFVIAIALCKLYTGIIQPIPINDV